MGGKRLVSLLVILALALVPLGCLPNTNKSNKTLPGPARTQKPRATQPTTPASPAQPKRPEVGGFYVNEPGEFDSLPSLKSHADILDELYPLWYHAKPDGSIEEEANQEAIRVAKSHKIRIFPLVNVVPSQDSVLIDPKARDNAIANIVRIVKQNNYDGINIDFEFMPETGKKDFSVDRNQMTRFMKLLSSQMKKLGKETHMSVLPVVGVSPEMSGVYDYKALGPLVDKVTVMCYDHSQEGSPPGPLAPFAWVEQNIKTAIRQGFKPSQICLGVATYGYDWPAGKAGGFSNPSRQLLQKAALKGYRVKWSNTYQEPYYIYTTPDGSTREVWFENYSTLQTKIKLVEKYKLSGVCIWRLGFEDIKFWQTLEKNWGRRK